MCIRDRYENDLKLCKISVRESAQRTVPPSSLMRSDLVVYEMLSLYLQPCNTLVQVCCQYSSKLFPSVLSQAQEIKSKFQRLFHKCHAIYDKNAVTEEEISQLGMYHTHSLFFSIYLIGFRSIHKRVHVLLSDCVS